MGEGRIHEIVLSLLLSEDLPRKQVLRILKHPGTPESGEGDAGLFPDLPALCTQLPDWSGDKRPEARRLLEGLADQGVGVTCLADSGYPRLLKEIPDPPVLLFHKGNLEDTASGTVAIVGSRRASLGGIRFAAHLAGELARMGFVVVSGLARGIDTAAHQGALEAGGDTIAVLGCGIDMVYPPENEALAQVITGSGAMVTEQLPGAQPLRANFPQRNRIISGLSLGTVVVEAGEKSGALITAACAVEQNRSVFAVPGTPGYYGSKGTNSLLKQGATLVESVRDILEEIAPQVDSRGTSSAQRVSRGSSSPAEEKILELLSGVPVHVDEIGRNLGLESRDVVSALFSLETRGLVKSVSGKFYVREGTI